MSRRNKRKPKVHFPYKRLKPRILRSEYIPTHTTRCLVSDRPKVIFATWSEAERQRCMLFETYGTVQRVYPCGDHWHLTSKKAKGSHDKGVL